MSILTTNNIPNIGPEAVKQPEAFTAWKTQVSENPAIRSIRQKIQNSPGQSFRKAAQLGWVVQAYAHIVDGADPNAKDASGKTPLHWAVVHGDINIIRALLASGAKPNAEDHNGTTPLKLALSPNSLRVATIQTLLEAGANPDLVIEIARQKMESNRDLYQEIIGLAELEKRKTETSAFVFVNEQLQGLAPDMVREIGEIVLRNISPRTTEGHGAENA